MWKKISRNAVFAFMSMAAIVASSSAGAAVDNPLITRLGTHEGCELTYVDRKTDTDSFLVATCGNTSTITQRYSQSHGVGSHYKVANLVRTTVVQHEPDHSDLSLIKPSGVVADIGDSTTRNFGKYDSCQVKWIDKGPDKFSFYMADCDASGQAVNSEPVFAQAPLVEVDPVGECAIKRVDRKGANLFQVYMATCPIQADMSEENYLASLYPLLR